MLSYIRVQTVGNSANHRRCSACINNNIDILRLKVNKIKQTLKLNRLTPLIRGDTESILFGYRCHSPPKNHLLADNTCVI